VTLYSRRLPHVRSSTHPVFLTWRLDGSLPSNRCFPVETLTSGKVFAAMDRLLDEARMGPVYMRQPRLADMVLEALEYNATRLGHYELHAFVIMPNHVHMLVIPAVPIPLLPNR